MAFSNESLHELNSRYDENSEKIITTRHFRPSIVVDKCPAFDEDLWMELKIGDAEFDCYKPCAINVSRESRFKLIFKFLCLCNKRYLVVGCN